MDVTALALHHATCCINESQCEIFDSVFQHYVVGDEGGFYRKARCSQQAILTKMMTLKCC
jgi:hypothetical protein